MSPPPRKNSFKRRGDSCENFVPNKVKIWRLSLFVPGFFLVGKASISKLFWNDGIFFLFLDLMNVSDGVHKLQLSKVFQIYNKLYVSDLLLINVNLYNVVVNILLERAALLVTALWKKKMIPSSLFPNSRGFLAYMMVRFSLKLVQKIDASMKF